MQSQIGLSIEQMALLEMPFRLDEHAWYDGKVYILKSAIRRRLSQVDPGWSLTPVQLVDRTDRIVAMTKGLDLCGVVRYGMGTNIIKPKETEMKQLGEINRAYKSADADCLTRAAQQFGVGAYLKDLPRSVLANEASFQRWLDSQTDIAPGAGPASDRQPPPRRSSPPPIRAGTAFTSPPPAGTNRGEGHTWLDNDSAAAALDTRLRLIHPALTRAEAERLVGQPLARYSGIETAVKAVAVAHQARIADEPA